MYIQNVSEHLMKAPLYHENFAQNNNLKIKLLYNNTTLSDLFIIIMLEGRVNNVR